MKICQCCKREKDFICFHLDNSRKDGYHNVCKICRGEKDKKRRQTPSVKEKDRLSKINNKSKRLFYAARGRALDKGLEFNISPEDIVIPDICPVLGIPIIRDAKSERVDGSPTLDRIDSSKGYTKDNICVISNKANTIKSFGTIEDHQKVIDYMKKFG
jgi:hypothetical protein